MQHWSYRIPTPPMWTILIFFSSAVVLAIAPRQASAMSGWCKRLALSLLLAAALLIAVFPFAPRWHRGSLELTVLDAGQERFAASGV